MTPLACAEQPCGQRRSEILHPPGALCKAGQSGDVSSLRQTNMPRQQAGPAQLFAPEGCVLSRLEVEVVGGRRDQRLLRGLYNVCTPLLRPARRDFRQQRWRLRKDRVAPHQRRHLARAAIYQRQRSGNRGVRRRLEDQRLRQCDAQHRPRLRIGG